MVRQYYHNKISYSQLIVSSYILLGKRFKICEIVHVSHHLFEETCDKVVRNIAVYISFYLRELYIYCDEFGKHGTHIPESHLILIIENLIQSQ